MHPALNWSKGQRGLSSDQTPSSLLLLHPVTSQTNYILLLYTLFSPSGEKDIIVKIMDETDYKKAIESLLSRVGDLEWSKYEKDDVGTGRVDATANLKIGNRKKKLLIELKSSGEPKVIAEYVGRLSNRPIGDCYPIIIAPFFSDRGREMCERSNIGCVDLSGNAYLEFDGIYINKWGSDNKYKVKRKQQKLLSPKSCWVIRCMLENPGKEWTMQELSNYSSVSLAQIYKVFDGLEAENYIKKRRGGTRLADPSGLLDLVSEKYRYDRQEITGYYTFLKGYDQIFSRLRQLPDVDYAVTLGAAARLVLPIVRSTDTHVYAGDPKVLRDALDLEPVEFGGNLYLITPKDNGVLKHIQVIDGVKVVSNLQLYLDLYNYPQRGREQADAIRSDLLGVNDVSKAIH